MPGKSVEIAVFLTRAEPRPYNSLASIGWSTTIMVERLPDGRDLWVVAGETAFPEEQRRELEVHKQLARKEIVKLSTTPASPRIILVAKDGKGTRRFVEAAV